MNDSVLALRKVEAAMARVNVRQALYQRLSDLGIHTEEARQAVDMVMEVAEAFDPKSPVHGLGKAMNDWTFLACTVQIMESGAFDGG